MRANTTKAKTKTKTKTVRTVKTIKISADYKGVITRRGPGKMMSCKFHTPYGSLIEKAPEPRRFGENPEVAVLTLIGAAAARAIEEGLADRRDLLAAWMRFNEDLY